MRSEIFSYKQAAMKKKKKNDGRRNESLNFTGISLLFPVKCYHLLSRTSAVIERCFIFLHQPVVCSEAQESIDSENHMPECLFDMEGLVYICSSLSMFSYWSTI